MEGNQARQIADYINGILCNNQDVGNRIPVSSDNLCQQLHDGVILCCLANSLSNKQENVIAKDSIKFQKATLFHKMDNVNRALDGFKKLDLSIVNIRAEFIVEKKQRSIAGLFNQLTRQRPAPKRQHKVVQEQQFRQEKVQNKTSEPVFIQTQERNSEQTNYQEEQGIFMDEHQNTEQQSHQSQQSHQPQQPAQVSINQNCYMPKQAANGYSFSQVFGPNILVLCGSLRKGSMNKSIIEALEQIKNRQFFDKIHFERPDLGHLPLFNQDLESHGRVPKVVYDLRHMASKANGILIATPEYNGCLTPAIKNALQWLARSDQNKNQASPLVGKKVGVVGTSYLSPAATNDVRVICGNCKANVFNQCFYVSLKSKAFDHESGKLISIEENDRLAMWYQDFSNFVLSGKPNPVPVPRWILER